MTTADALIPDTRTPGNGMRGAHLLTWYSFWKLLTNPFSLGFAVFLPIFMYLMFGAGQEYSSIWTVHANVAASVLVNMAVYGAIMVTSSMGANVALERTSGISRLYAMTPLASPVLIFARIVASMMISVVIILITYTVGYFTGARMHPEAWVGSFAMIIALSALPATIGLAMAFAVRSDGAFAAASAITVVCSFASGMFIPLEGMGDIWMTAAPYTPFYGLVQMVQLPLYGWGDFEWSWLVNYLAWTAGFIALAAWAVSRDTGR